MIYYPTVVSNLELEISEFDVFRKIQGKILYIKFHKSHTNSLTIMLNNFIIFKLKLQVKFSERTLLWKLYLAIHRERDYNKWMTSLWYDKGRKLHSSMTNNLRVRNDKIWMFYDQQILPKSKQSDKRLIRFMGNQQVPKMTTMPISIRFVLFVRASSSNLFFADLINENM